MTGARRSSRARAACGLALAGWLVCSQAPAEPLESGAFRLEWTAPSGCPDGPSVLARVESLLGAKVSAVLRSPLAARARVEQASAEHFQLALETFQNEQRFTREMQAPSCDELAGAAALVLAIAIDPELSERLAEAAPPPAAAPADPAVAEAPAPPPKREPDTRPPVTKPPAPGPNAPVRAARAESSKVGVFAGAAVTTDLGSIASFAVGPAVGAGVRYRAFELGLEATWLPARRSFSANPQKGGDISLITASVRPCGVYAYERFELGLCGALDLGDIRGTGFGTANRTTRHALWSAAGGGLLARHRVTPALALKLTGGALATLQDIEFSLENVGVVYEVPRVVGRLGLGLEAHFD